MSYQVNFEPVGRRVNSPGGETILSAAQHAGIMMNAVCGGAGVCGHCLVRILNGNVAPIRRYESKVLSPEKASQGWRFACQTIIQGDLDIYLPPETLANAQRTQVESEAVEVSLQPAVTAVQLTLPIPSLDDLRSDAERIRDTLENPDLTFSTGVLRAISTDLRAYQFRPTVYVHGPKVIGIRPQNAPLLGFAVDIGTTKLAGYLVDLRTGKTLASIGKMNPQIAYGEDVMSRISYSMQKAENSHSRGEELRSSIIEALNDMAQVLCLQTKTDPEDIADAVCVGNTAMHHLFLGLPVKQLGIAPYVSAENAALDLPASDLGLKFAPGALVHILPNIAGFVGADHVAMLLASNLPARGKVVLALDIGTNTEVSLVANGRHFACSTASGPAFEGAHIRFGMRAAPGAIEKVIIEGTDVTCNTIDNRPAIGICGSGILDTVAQMRKNHLLTPRGKFIVPDSDLKSRFNEAQNEFVLVPAKGDGSAITFSRNDVNEIQLSKAAMRTGIKILLKKAGVEEENIDQVVIAGAFGSYLDVESGIEIGMFPQIDASRYRQIGNAAGEGAKMALISTRERERAVQIAKKVEYIELTTQKDFPSLFARSLMLD